MKLNKEDIKLGLAVELAKYGMSLDDLEAELSVTASEKRAGFWSGLMSMLGTGASATGTVAKKGLTVATLAAAGLGGLAGLGGYGAYRAIKGSDEDAEASTHKGIALDRAIKELQASKLEQQLPRPY